MIITRTLTMQADVSSTVVEMDSQTLSIIFTLLRQALKVDAIKFLRYVYQLKYAKPLGLKEAKDIVDYLNEHPDFRID